jgi:hypothetical protein
MTEVLPVPRFDYEFDLPDGMELGIWLGPHGVAEDLPEPEFLKALFEQSDMVILEGMGRTDFADRNDQKIAHGNPKAFQLFLDSVGSTANASWQTALYTALKGSKAKVRNVDLPFGHPLIQLTDEAVIALSRTAREPDFLKAVNDYHPLLVRRQQLQQDRDQYILDHFAERVRTSGGMKRLGGQAVKATMIYGNSHAPLHYALVHRAGMDDMKDITFSSRIASEPDYLLPARQAYEEHIIGDGITEETSLKHLMHNVLDKIYRRTGRIGPSTPTGDVTKMINDELAGLDFHEMRKLRGKALWSVR